MAGLHASGVEIDMDSGGMHVWIIHMYRIATEDAPVRRSMARPTYSVLPAHPGKRNPTRAPDCQ